MWLVVVANVFALGTQPLFGMLADRIGRKPVFIYGALSSAVMLPFYLLSMSGDNTVLTFALAVATFAFGYGAANAVWPSFYGEMFSTQVRFSGMAIGTQLGFLVAGFAPSIITALGGVQEGGWVVISIFTAVVCVIATVSALTARETKRRPHAAARARPARFAEGSGERLTMMTTIDTNPDAAAASQAQITDEIAAIESDYHRGGIEETQPRLDYPPYRSSLLRHPTRDLHHADPEGVERWAPCFGERDLSPLESDLTIGHGGEPIGERMVVTGRVVDGDGRPVRRQLVEIWQANAGGRYVHKRDQHRAALDPNFTGVGRCLTDDDGTYRFTTIKPGPYPWKQPPQCLAARAHPLLAVRNRIHATDGHPDVLPRRPAVRSGPDLSVHHRPEGPRPARRVLRPQRDDP